ncbi:MAG TPA: hypothetical protein DEH78_23825, partial [Solibacterales bacterium]|nr:hypothetical protein [Bryobacterales bacterium]
MSRTRYAYDLLAAVGFTCAQGEPLARSGIIQFDTALAGVHERGNAACIARWQSDPSPGKWLVTQRTFDVAGNVLSEKDPRSYTTDFDYTDNFLNGPPPGPTFSMPTKVTNALSHETATTYDYGTGKPVRITDPNGQSTTFEYTDPLDRLRTVNRPLGRTIEHTYIDDSTRTLRTRVLRAAGQWITTEAVYDGFGRTVESRQLGPTTIKTAREYDGFGRLRRVSNPYETGTPVYTTTAYDALDRTLSVTTPDGAATTTDYTGETTTVTDPAGKKRLLVSDALGRIKEVREAPDDTTHYNWLTSYEYDAADRLKGVTQGAQARSFTYDTMGWLRTAINPEKTTADTYLYDNNGNLTKKTSGAFTIDFESIDALNRVTLKRYSDQPSAPLTYTYDTCANGKGRLCSTQVGGGTSVSYAFDAAGRITASTQTTGTAYSFTYTYTLADALESIEYPSGKKINYAFDSAGRVTEVASPATAGPTYAASIQYAPHGALKQLTLGNSLVESQSYNERLQMTGVTLGTRMALRLSYCPGLFSTCSTNNGNVLRQEIEREKTGTGTLTLTLRQDYGYDPVNRFTSVSETVLAGGAPGNWSLTFGYDRYGNQWINTASIPVSLAAARNQGQYDANRNRLTKQYN